MALYTRTEFAAKCALSSGNLSNYIQRGKVVVTEQDMVDDADAVNQLFIAKRAAKTGGTNTAPAKKTTKAKKEQPADKPARTKKPDALTQLEVQRKELETQKLKKDLELQDMKLARQNGDLVPTEVVRALFAQHFKSTYTAFESAFYNALAQLAKKHGIDAAGIATCKASLKKNMNTAIQKAVDSSKKSIETLVKEYSDARSRGERKLL